MGYINSLPDGGGSSGGLAGRLGHKGQKARRDQKAILALVSNWLLMETLTLREKGY